MSKIKCTVKINAKKSLDELPNAYSNKDYQEILDLMGYSDEVSDDEIKEMTMMAISDHEPEESAEILLKYSLQESLTEGQIKQLSHEMQEDKVSEEYPDIFLQQDFFKINQLLFKSFNGKFPNCHAEQVEIEVALKNSSGFTQEDISDAWIIYALLPALGDHSVIARLYQDELARGKEFADAEGIIWSKNIEKIGEGKFKIQFYSSAYWMSDLPASSDDFETTLPIFEPEEAH